MKQRVGVLFILLLVAPPYAGAYVLEPFWFWGVKKNPGYFADLSNPGLSFDNHYFDIPVNPVVSTTDEDQALLMITLVQSKFPLLGQIMQSVVWTGDDNSQVIAIAQFLLDPVHHEFAMLLNQDDYLVSLHNGALLEESETQVAFFIWVTTRPAVSELLFNHLPADLLGYLHFIHQQPFSVRAQLLSILADGAGAIFIDILKGNTALSKEVLRLLQLPWPRDAREQLLQALVTLLLDAPAVQPWQLFYMVSGHLYQTGSLGFAEDYPSLHSGLVTWLKTVLPSKVSQEHIASALLVMIESNQQLLLSWQGHTSPGTQENIEATALLAQMESMAQGDPLVTVLSFLIRWPALIQVAVTALNHGLNPSQLPSVACIHGFIDVLNTVLPDPLVMGVPDGSSIRQPMSKAALAARREEQFSSWMKERAAGVLPDDPDRIELLRQIYRRSIISEGLLDLGIVQPGLLKEMLKHPWVMGWLCQFAWQMPGRKTGEDYLSGVVEHAARILGPDSINTLWCRQRFMIRLLVRLSNNWQGPFQIHPCQQITHPQINIQLNTGIQGLHSCFNNSEEPVSAPVLTLLIHNPVLLQAIMNPVPSLVSLQISQSVSTSAVLAGLNHVNAAVLGASGSLGVPLAEMILNHPVITHSWLAAITSEAQAQAFLQFITSVQPGSLSQLTEGQMMILTQVARANTENPVQISVQEREYKPLLGALNFLANGLLTSTHLYQVAEYLYRRFHQLLSDHPTAEELSDLLKKSRNNETQL